ncbi:hypothetical protein D3C71_2076080 [compost metagenome]
MLALTLPLEIINPGIQWPRSFTLGSQIQIQANMRLRQVHHLGGSSSAEVLGVGEFTERIAAYVGSVGSQVKDLGC